MADRILPSVTSTTPIGPDVDLDAEDVRLADGSRLTEDRTAEIVDVGADRRGGCDGGRGAVGHGDHPRSWVGMTWMTSR